jgi:hypothetical protein
MSARSTERLLLALRAGAAAGGSVGGASFGTASNRHANADQSTRLFERAGPLSGVGRGGARHRAVVLGKDDLQPGARLGERPALIVSGGVTRARASPVPGPGEDEPPRPPFVHGDATPIDLAGTSVGARLVALPGCAFPRGRAR